MTMNCVMMMKMKEKRVSKQNDDIKAESSTKRGYTYVRSQVLYTRARTTPVPTHDTSDEYEDDGRDQLIIAPDFTNKILKGGR